MRVALSTLQFRPGVAGSHEPYLAGLLGALSAGHGFLDIILLANRLAEKRIRAFAPSRPTVVVPHTSGLLGRIAIEQLLLAQLARRRGASVLHSTGSTACLANRGLRQVVTIHYDLDVEHRRSLSLVKRVYLTGAFRSTVRRADVLIVPSRSFARSFKDRWNVDSDRVQVVYHGVRTIPDAPVRTTTSWALGRRRGPFILAVTNMLPHKNLGVLLRVFSRLWQAGRRFRLVIAGNVSPGGFGSLCASLRREGTTVPAEQVYLLGQVTHDEVCSLYRDASVLLLTTKTESFSLPLLEAMAHACPVVASDIPVHREIAEEAVLYAPPDDVEAWVEACDHVLDQERRHASAPGIARAREFTWERTARDTVAAYFKESSRGKKRGFEIP